MNLFGFFCIFFPYSTVYSLRIAPCIIYELLYFGFHVAPSALPWSFAVFMTHAEVNDSSRL